jgi:hypothetical protein
VPPLAAKKRGGDGRLHRSTEDGVTTTLGRGGSDFTASIVGAGIGAEEIQIWTDVDGMLTADPTILPGGHRVKTISFAEAAELAYFGAKVLHPATVVPAIEKNIPVLILNSRRPDVPGTRIVSEACPASNVVKSIACKRKITLVNIHSTRMLMAHGFLRRIFEVFDRHETRWTWWRRPKSACRSPSTTRARWTPSAELRQFAEAGVEHDQAIVCLVGENIRYTPGVARAFNALDGINIRMISQGASLLNLSFVVAEADLHAAVEALHASSFRARRRAVFDPTRPCMPERPAAGHRRLRQDGPHDRAVRAGIRFHGGAEARRIQQRQLRRVTAENFRGIDVAIDFSIPAAVRRNVEAHRRAGREHRGRHHRLAGTLDA